MIRQWEEFEAGPHVRSGERLHVSLSKKGVILLNEKTFEAIGSPAAAALLFDKRNSSIGVRATHIDRKSAFTVKSKPKARHRVIHASTFCRHYGIKVDRTIAFPTAEVDDDGTLILDLHSATMIGRA